MLTLRNKTVTVSRELLIERLKQNLGAHQLAFDRAVKLYKQTVTADLAAATKAIKANKLNSADAVAKLLKLRIDFNAPVSHIADYEKAIDMLTWSTQDTIELDEDSFAAYINNEWPWADSFRKTVETYQTAGRLKF